MITKSSGFSLVELLVVIAIIGILSATGMVVYSGYISSAKKSTAKSLMAQIALAQSEHYANSGSYFKTDFTPNCQTLNPIDKEEQLVPIETPKSAAFFNATLMLFLCLDKPVSIHIKPACMMKTKIAQSITHKVSILLVKISITS